MGKPWEDESLASDATKKLREGTRKLKQDGLQPRPKPAIPGISNLNTAFDQAARIAKRNRKFDLATRPLRKALPKQD